PRTQTRYDAFGSSGITYRPRSSVTTILANFVGRSVVSAITHTPASGPPALRTTPPRSVAPTRIAGSVLGCAPSPPCQPATSPAVATIITTAHNALVVLIDLMVGTSRAPVSHRL